MKPLQTVVLLLATFFLQPTAASLIPLGGASPNLLLCITLILVIKAREPAPIIGLCVLTSILQELCFSLYAGPAPAAIFIIGITAVFAGKFLALEHPIFLAGLTAADTLVYSGILWVGQVLLGAPYGFLQVLRLQPAYAAHNLVLMALLYLLFLKNAEGRYSI